MTVKKPGARYFKGSIGDRLEFYSIPEPNSGCQIWFGATTSGYGCVWYKGKRRKAHAAAYEEAKGPIPDGMEAHHKCRLKCCINVSHLQPLTRSEHMRVEWRPKAYFAAMTQCKNGHEMNEVNSYRSPTTGRRACRVCRRVTMYAKRHDLTA